MTSTEKMTVELFYDNSWHPVTEYVNNGSFGWRNETFLLPGAGGHRIQIGFRANGINQYNFQDWFIDNIQVYPVCPPPVGLQASVSSGCVMLNWKAPCLPQQSMLYDIYRSDNYGNPPYLKMNGNEIPDTTFSQVPPWTLSYTYKYYVVALEEYSYYGVICESASSDTVQVSFPVGIEGSARNKVSIYPVPANDYIIVTCDFMITGLCITDQLGRTLYKETAINSKRIMVNSSAWSPGVYYARVNTPGAAMVMKFIIQK